MEATHLVLTRKHRETIVIGDNVVITFLGSKPSRVMVSAPPKVKILRGELEERKGATA